MTCRLMAQCSSTQVWHAAWAAKDSRCACLQPMAGGRYPPPQISKRDGGPSPAGHEAQALLELFCLLWVAQAVVADLFEAGAQGLGVKGLGERCETLGKGWPPLGSHEPHE